MVCTHGSCPQENGKPGRRVDFQKLNQACLPEGHHTRTPFGLITMVPRHTFKTLKDAYSMYHQISLDTESCTLTTFITPMGRFRYRRTPMGRCAGVDDAVRYDMLSPSKLRRQRTPLTYRVIT